MSNGKGEITTNRLRLFVSDNKCVTGVRGRVVTRSNQIGVVVGVEDGEDLFQQDGYRRNVSSAVTEGGFST